MSIFATDGVGDVLHSALDGISYRENVIANNIANVDTPHFRASTVDFESSLRSAIESGHVDGASASFTTSPTLTPVGANDNNVDIRHETMAAMQSVFQYQIVSRAVSDRLDMVKTAAGSF